MYYLLAGDGRDVHGLGVPRGLPSGQTRSSSWGCEAAAAKFYAAYFLHVLVSDLRPDRALDGRQNRGPFLKDVDGR